MIVLNYYKISLIMVMGGAIGRKDFIVFHFVKFQFHRERSR